MLYNTDNSNDKMGSEFIAFFFPFFFSIATRDASCRY